MENNQLKIIDWDLGLRLAGNKKEIAEELLGLLVQTLPEEISALKTLHKTKDYQKLSQRVHKLHGAVCYCGVPRLKNRISSLEIELRNNITSSLPLHLEQLETEINLLFEHLHQPH